MKAKYVAAVIFNADLSEVWLIRKTRSPKGATRDMSGKLNFPGGHVEEGETPLAAISREIIEECGYDGAFVPFCAISGEYGDSRGYGWIHPNMNTDDAAATCLCFWSRAAKGVKPMQLTDEKIISVPLESLYLQPTVDDVEYLAFIALGLAKAMQENNECMNIQETHASKCTEVSTACNKCCGMA